MESPYTDSFCYEEVEENKPLTL